MVRKQWLEVVARPSVGFICALTGQTPSHDLAYSSLVRRSERRVRGENSSRHEACEISCKVSVPTCVPRLSRRVARSFARIATFSLCRRKFDMLYARRCLSLGLSLALVLACNPPAGPQSGPADAAASAATPGDAQPTAVGSVPNDAAVVAEVTAVFGPAGVRTDDLADGTFLGEGAKLHARQVLQVPRGTLAELRLTNGVLLRVNEDTRLGIPGANEVDLASGEVVAIVTTDQQPLTIRSGGDTFEVSHGEARALHRDGRHSYDVVYGTARLRSGGQDIAMGPGAHMQTPLAATDAAAPPAPVVSLRPLEDTAWSRTFEIAATMVDAVPPGVGSLTARRAGSSVHMQKLAVVEQKVHVSISGRIARTEIEQTFYNSAGEVLEGTYRFPLPADASISGLSLLVGNRWMNAEMLEKQRANRIFNQIVDATIPRDPALLEWERGNIFKMRIFPIPGRGERKIRLSYTQVLPAAGESLRYRYPLAGASSGASGTEIGDFEFTVDIDRAEITPEALAAIATPMAQLERSEQPDRAVLTTRKQRFRPVHDLGVDIPLSGQQQRQHAETFHDRDGQAYFMLAVRPELPLAKQQRPIHYAFVLDRSHSITPELWTVARSMVHALGGGLGADDRMTVLACDTACDAVPGGLLPGSTETLARVDSFLDQQYLAGASDLGGMMMSAAEALAGADSQVEPERVVVYLGDGNATAGAMAPDELLRHLAGPLTQVRVQAVALGARSDLLLLDALTRRSGGDLMRADAKDDLRALTRELRLRAQVPVARNVALTLPKGMVYVHPRELGALRAGDSLVLVGKLSEPVHGMLELRAQTPDGATISDQFQVDLEAVGGPGRHTHLPRTWAHHEIADLTATQGTSARAEIIDLSRQYTVLSRYTALLVLENDAMFREFNVVRQAGRTTGWDGQLAGPQPPLPPADPKGSAGLQASASAAPPSPEPDFESAAEKQAPGDTPTPQPAPAPAKDAKKAESWDDDAVNESSRADRVQAADEEEATPDADWNDDSLAPPMSAPASRPSAPAPPAQRDTASKEKKASSAKPLEVARGDNYDYDEGYGGLGTSGGGYGRGGLAKRLPPSWRISQASAPSAATQNRLETLRQATLRDPTSRAAHRRLVQAAIRAGVPEAFTYAVAWAAADPDHVAAVLAVADLLAARGDAAAPRAYGSAAEINPSNRKLQTRLAEAYASKGDWTRSCAHRRAVVSIDPNRADNHAELARCLTQLGRQDYVRAALDDGLARAKGNVGVLRNPVLSPKPSKTPSGALRATITWAGAADLDVAIIDGSGRRLSVLRPEGLGVLEQPSQETVAVAKVASTVYVEVTRFSGQGPVHGELTLRTSELTRKYPFTIDQGSLRMADVTFTQHRWR